MKFYVDTTYSVPAVPLYPDFHAEIEQLIKEGKLLLFTHSVDSNNHLVISRECVDSAAADELVTLVTSYFSAHPDLPFLSCVKREEA